MANKQLGMAIDVTRCIGCSTCAMACKVENNLPSNVWWNRVMTDGSGNQDSPSGDYPNLTMQQYTLSCQHCADPACTRACPTGATYKDPETGVVRVDPDRCIGCRMCVMACPYTGVRTYLEDEPKYPLDYALGDADAPKHEAHTVEKCTFCWHRLQKGLQPACVEVCPARARVFGDLNDPDSDISKLLAKRENKQLLAEEGTNPSLRYIVA